MTPNGEETPPPIPPPATKETPAVAMQVLRDAVRQAVKTPQFMEAMAKIGTEVAYLDEDQYYIEAWEKESKVFGEVLQRLGKLE